jgi:hypothetical protein
MTVLSLQWLLPRPRRRATVTRPRRRATVTRPWRRATVTQGLACHPRRAERRRHQDPFFADPSAVEDDSRRMRPDAGRAR